MVGRGGFTLLEMSLVVLIMGLSIGVLALTFREPYERATFQAAIETACELDRTARERAKSAGEANCRLTFDLDRDEMVLEFPGSGGLSRQTVRMPRGVELGQVRTAFQSHDRNRMSLEYRASAGAPTYGIRFDGRMESRWVLVLGGTGQIRISADENEIEAIFRTLQAEGIDAR